MTGGPLGGRCSAIAVLVLRLIEVKNFSPGEGNPVRFWGGDGGASPSSV
jgi:hypothetical protein